MPTSSSSLSLLGEIQANGQIFLVYLRRRKIMKNIHARLSPRTDAVIISAHPRVPLTHVYEFLKKAQAWLEEATRKRPKRLPFTPGLQIPVLGQVVTLEHCESSKRQVTYTHAKLVASGAASEFNTQIKRFLKQLALQETQKQSLIYANLLGTSLGKISIKDMVSCWGSCSGKGNLSFNWRLVLAPPAILSYLCAHEVAHLKHKNHSLYFWKTVESLCPDYKEAKAWLKTQGTSLLAYGSPST